MSEAAERGEREERNGARMRERYNVTIEATERYFTPSINPSLNLIPNHLSSFLIFLSLSLKLFISPALASFPPPLLSLSNALARYLSHYRFLFSSLSFTPKHRALQYVHLVQQAMSSSKKSQAAA
eukprot:1382497-Amorphochlora_amoeboformis.AAC.1